MSAQEVEKARALQRRRKHIQENIRDAGTLSDFASVIVRYIYHLSPGCYFERRNGSKYEWDLTPDRWISLYLSKGRYGTSGKVVISMDIGPSELRTKTKLEILPGRLPYRSRIKVTSASHFGDALHAVSQVGGRNA